MSIVRLDEQQDFVYYLGEGGVLDKETARALWPSVRQFFPETEEWSAYEQALFLAFLVYISGDEKRLQAIIKRLGNISTASFLPESKKEMLRMWLGLTEEKAVQEEKKADVLSEEAYEKVRPLYEQLKESLEKRVENYRENSLDSFRRFFETIRDELFLDELEIHSDEFVDRKLEKQAMRWEYKYLGRDQTMIEKRRKTYLERQDEWLKSN